MDKTLEDAIKRGSQRYYYGGAASLGRGVMIELAHLGLTVGPIGKWTAEEIEEAKVAAKELARKLGWSNDGD